LMITRVFRKISKIIGYRIEKLPVNATHQADFERLRNDAQSLENIKLHFGCGPRVLKEWLNFDLFFTPFEPYLKYYTDEHYPEKVRGTRNDLYVIDIIQSGLPLPDESVDLIFHEDFFEHLTQKQQVVFLAETLRTMKKGAVHRINTPNIIAAMRDQSNFAKGKDGVDIGEWDNWHHHNIISPAILKDMALMVGYSDVVFNSKNNSVIANFLPSEYRPDDNARSAADSNVFADLIK